jgi:hypothetical protein
VAWVRSVGMRRSIAERVRGLVVAATSLGVVLWSARLPSRLLRVISVDVGRRCSMTSSVERQNRRSEQDWASKAARPRERAGRSTHLRRHQRDPTPRHLPRHLRHAHPQTSRPTFPLVRPTSVAVGPPARRAPSLLRGRNSVVRDEPRAPSLILSSDSCLTGTCGPEGSNPAGEREAAGSLVRVSTGKSGRFIVNGRRGLLSQL